MKLCRPLGIPASEIIKSVAFCLSAFNSIHFSHHPSTRLLYPVYPTTISPFPVHAVHCNVFTILSPVDHLLLLPYRKALHGCTFLILQPSSPRKEFPFLCTVANSLSWVNLRWVK
jgi:hypothetical protein|uniref:Uncharacterized protein n=1 Tax=Mus musculus TaxID=10090 RepID=Q9DAQ6_MOUSE|nr:unnamed protein product [Mus musculus]